MCGSGCTTTSSPDLAAAVPPEPRVSVHPRGARRCARFDPPHSVGPSRSAGGGLPPGMYVVSAFGGDRCHRLGSTPLELRLTACHDVGRQGPRGCRCFRCSGPCLHGCPGGPDGGIGRHRAGRDTDASQPVPRTRRGVDRRRVRLRSHTGASVLVGTQGHRGGWSVIHRRARRVTMIGLTVVATIAASLGSEVFQTAPTWGADSSRRTWWPLRTRSSTRPLRPSSRRHRWPPRPI